MTLPLIDQPVSSAGASGLIDIDATFLPVGRMRQIARVTSVDETGIRGEVPIDADHWVWDEHFPGDPIFPGTLMIEAAGQLVALWAWADGQRGRPRLVRTDSEFHNPVHPGDSSLTLIAEVRRRRTLNFGTVRIASGHTSVATVEAVLAVLPHGP
jgi:3-hydroxymyristoyl/3-hydroxydecanoyl-(acyl carrier protein) dehydratase